MLVKFTTSQQGSHPKGNNYQQADRWTERERGVSAACTKLAGDGDICLTSINAVHAIVWSLAWVSPMKTCRQIIRRDDYQLIPIIFN